MCDTDPLGQGWIDVTAPIASGMLHWPGDRDIEVKRLSDVNQGAEVTLSQLEFSAHTGTHMDAPLHFVAGGAGMRDLPLQAVMGRARVLGIDDPRVIDKQTLQTRNIEPGERLLFRTRNSRHAWWKAPFDEDFVHIAPRAAAYLAECKVRTVGMDYLSVGGFREGGTETHRALLGAGIWLIEGLDLTQVDPGEYEMICLPLHIEAGEGAPARALLRPL